MAASDPIGNVNAAAQVATQADFERIFREPSIEKMLALTPRDFERFIAHVFECAGYRVEDVARQFFPEGPGVDLNLYAGPSVTKPIARVEIKRWQQNVTLARVMQFIGVLQVAGGIPGYMVSTGGFVESAEAAAEMASQRINLINGERLLRYIAYVGGSRLNGAFAGGSIGPIQPTSPAWLEQGDLFVEQTQRPPRHARVLAILNTKGGVAKTTTALNIGFALSDRHQQRVLMIDLDGQASLTRSLPGPPAPGAPRNAPPEPDTVSLVDYLKGQLPLEQLIRPTRFERLWVTPASRELYHLQFTGGDRARMELGLAKALRTAQVRDETGALLAPDWIILDTPAGDTFFARAAIVAADCILIPALAETYGLLGINEALALTRTMNALTTVTAHWSDRILGCLVTRWKPSANATANLNSIRVELDRRGIRFFKRAIPVDDKVETAHRGEVKGERRTIFQIGRQPGQAAQAYDAVAEEIL